MNDFCKNSSQCPEILLHVKWAIASFRCQNNPEVMATLIMTNFHLYLIIFSKCLSMATQLCSKLGGIEPEKLLQYRATFICQYGLCCCIVWPSFPFDYFLKIWATCENFLGKWYTPPPSPLRAKKTTVRLERLKKHVFARAHFPKVIDFALIQTILKTVPSVEFIKEKGSSFL